MFSVGDHVMPDLVQLFSGMVGLPDRGIVTVPNHVEVLWQNGLTSVTPADVLRRVTPASGQERDATPTFRVVWLPTTQILFFVRDLFRIEKADGSDAQTVLVGSSVDRDGSPSTLLQALPVGPSPAVATIESLFGPAPDFEGGAIKVLPIGPMF